MVLESRSEEQEGEVHVIDVDQAPEDSNTNLASEGKPQSIIEFF